MRALVNGVRLGYREVRRVHTKAYLLREACRSVWILDSHWFVRKLNHHSQCGVNMSKVLRIRLKSYDHQLLDQAAQEIMNKVKMDEEDNSRISGPFPLPTTINRWTVLRSPHVNKKSREQFERRTHHRLIDIASPTQREMQVLQNLILPAGIFVRMKPV